MSNRLAGETSPYLLHHSDNPVDWYPWGDEAFAAAHRLDRPLFVSIGYSTCHWCHVMESESFRDAHTARLMNEAFVCVKVDREERPDVDRAYMDYAVMSTGSAGWPLTVIATPDGKPFFVATYIPRESAGGRAGLRDLVPAVSRAWRERRGEVEAAARRGAAVLVSGQPGGTAAADVEAASSLCFRVLRDSWDSSHGGFGGAPRFPSPHNLVFLLRYWHRTGEAAALEMATGTLDAIRRGGIWDQLGHGIHRYSTDRMWIVPHFEKMLYDQALLLMACTEAFRATGEGRFRTMGLEIASYVGECLTSGEGAFFSAEDADGPGGEGAFYTWTPGEIASALPGADAGKAMEFWGVTPGGNCDGRSVLHVALPGDVLPPEMVPLREALEKAREGRVRPFLDRKVLADWNGLMTAALARASWALDSPGLLDRASTAAGFLLSELSGEDGSIRHCWIEGTPGGKGFLDDYAFTEWAMLELYQATFGTRYLREAVRLQGILDGRFADAGGGGYFFTDGEEGSVLGRTVRAYDGALPSGNSVAFMNLRALWRLTGITAYRDSAERIEARFSGTLGESPTALTMMLSCIEAERRETDVVIAGPAGDPSVREMTNAVREGYRPGMLVLRADPADPLPEGMAAYARCLEDTVSAAVCTGGTCGLPVHSAADLRELLD